MKYISPLNSHWLFSDEPPPPEPKFFDREAPRRRGWREDVLRDLIVDAIAENRCNIRFDPLDLFGSWLFEKQCQGRRYMVWFNEHQRMSYMWPGDDLSYVWGEIISAMDKLDDLCSAKSEDGFNEADSAN